MSEIFIVRLAPQKNIPRSMYMVSTCSMSGDADAYNYFSKLVKTDSEVLTILALLHFAMQKGRNVDKVADEDFLKELLKLGLPLPTIPVSDLFYDLICHDVTTMDGRTAMLIEVSVSWFNERGEEYVCAFNKPGTTDLVEKLTA